MKTKHKPLISIAMTTYNGEVFLDKQIDSIINQTYKNIELVICDDISSDNTVEIIKAYIKKYSFIKLYQNEVNLGFVKNFEKAIRLCQGEYIALSDQDDIWELNKLELYITEIKKIEKEYNNSPIMVHSDLVTIDATSRVVNKSYFKFRNYTFNNKSVGSMLGPCGVMGNTILFNKALKNIILPFPDKLEYHDYWIALVNELLGKRITLNMQLVKYRLHDNNSSNSVKKISHKKTFFDSMITSIKRDFVLPYKTITRKKVIEELLYRYNLDQNDKKIVEIFLKYLDSSLSRLFIMYYMIRYDYIKKGLKYRFLVLLKVLLKK